jgi:hypothetical protein
MEKGLLDNPDFILVDPTEPSIGDNNSDRKTKTLVNSLGPIKLFKAESITQDNCTLYNLVIKQTILTLNVGVKNNNNIYYKFNYFQFKQVKSRQVKFMLSTIFLFLFLEHIKYLNSKANEDILGIFLPREEIKHWNHVCGEFLSEYFMTSADCEEVSFDHRGKKRKIEYDTEDATGKLKDHFLLFFPFTKFALSEIIGITT